MSIEDLARQSINEIKSKWGLPKEGFIAGGALANLIWEKISGNKAVINDIDVFILNKLLDKKPTNNNYIQNGSELMKLFNHNKEPVFHENYDGMMIYNSITKNYYLIDSVENDNLFNYIKYNSNSPDMNAVVDSFDINCVQIGYSIQDDKFYWTKNFEDFLLTGDIELTNLQTPSHTAIRLVKKSDELNANLNDIELEMCATSIYRNYTDIVKRYFSDKYATNYTKYEERLNKFFKLRRDPNVESILKIKKNIDISIFNLDTNFKINTNSNSYIGDDLIFYIRSVQKNTELNKLWSEISFIVNRQDYIDCKYTDEDIKFLKRLINVSPGSINRLRNKKLSTQLNMVKTIFNKFKDDPIIAISVLENTNINIGKDLDDEDLLLMELMVRKEIINDVNRKVDRLLYDAPDDIIDELFGSYI